MFLERFDNLALEVGSFFIPVGWITKLKYVKWAVSLFKLKRGINGSYIVYRGVDALGIVKYIGITERDAAIRWAEHKAAIGSGKELLDYEVVEKAIGLSKTEARILEQTLINQHGLGKFEGQLLNKINSIVEKYWEKHGIPGTIFK